MITFSDAKLLMVSFLMLFTISACAGKQGVVNVDQTTVTYGKKDYGIHKSEKIKFGVIGLETYVGKPNSITFFGYSVNVNLRAIQEAVASKILGAIFDEVVVASNKNPNIISEISDFSYSWDFSLTARPSVSFKMKLFVRKDGNLSLYKEVVVRDFNGGEERLLLGGIFGMVGSAINEEHDKRSQLVTNAITKAVYGIYENEMPKIAGVL